ncbi:MAG: tRNA (adenosine(37)-N6)-threonylcarbamoyltransferase complex ATPase subunit type 1 TsaE [Candidatus Kapaibacteriales bacterium]
MYYVKNLTHNEEETYKFAMEFAKLLVPGDIVTLTGDLGAGKTVFVRGICNFFEVKELVTSPTFTIMNQYIGIYKKNEFFIFHIDIYRIKRLEELAEIGFNECLEDPASIKLIEWAEKANLLIPKPYYKVLFENEELDDNRIITITLIET